MTCEDLWKKFMKTLSSHVEMPDLPWDKEFNLDMEKFAKDYIYFKKIHDTIENSLNENSSSTSYTSSYMRKLLNPEDIEN